MFHQLSKNARLEKAISVTDGAAAATAITGTTIDTQGFQGVLFVVQIGAIVANAVTSIKVQHDNDSAMGTVADVAGTSQTIADNDDEKVLYIDLAKITKRYVRLYVSRATQNATVTATALLYNAGSAPTTQGTGVIGETFASAGSGTA